MNAPIEVKWIWRRVTTIGVLVWALGLVSLIVWKTADPEALRWIALALIGLCVFAHAVYLVGATRVDLAKIAEAVRPTMSFNSNVGPEGGP